MRLLPDHIAVIKLASAEIIGAEASVRVFGSRLDDQARGGDIDLLVEVPAALPNRAKAERLGWLASVDDWLLVRKLRNRMIHDYVRDPAELAQALQAAHEAVPMLFAALDQFALATLRFAPTASNLDP